MAGNVWEWARDWYEGYDANEINNPTGPSSGTYRVLRGGSWNFKSWYIRAANRSSDDPTSWFRDVGFRCVFQPKPDSTAELQTTQVRENATRQPDPIQTNAIAPTSTPTPKPSPTITPTPDPALGIGSTKTRQKDGMEMVYVPEGSFEMGSATGDDDEKPVRQVYLDAYWIDKYEVTNGQYKQCVDAGMCTKPNGIHSNHRSSYYGTNTYANYPVINVDWYQAQTYCQWAGGDLPTEAQWEKAARGTDGREFPWGNKIPNSAMANFGNYKGDTVEVGTYPYRASPYGALDMAGNVWEWVRDRYGDYDANETNNPTGPSSGAFRVLRGGSWDLGTRGIRAADRYGDNPAAWGTYIGFRCVSPP